MKTCDIHCQCTIFHRETLDKVEKSLMDDDTYEGLTGLFKVFSDLTRIKILEAIREDALCVCDLAHLLSVSKSAISHQMKFLKSYHLVTSNKKGKMVYYRLSNPHASNIISDAHAFMKGSQP